jgi:hypothetical protein
MATITSRLLSTAALGVLAMGTTSLTASANSTDPWEVFANSAYGYCDAKKLSSVWSNSIEEAKVVLGQKILNRIQHLSDWDISTATNVGCSADEISLYPEDEQKLARFWGVSADQARAQAIGLINQMGEKQFYASTFGAYR